MTVQSSKMRVFSFDRYTFRIKFSLALHIEIYTASCGFLALARLLFKNVTLKRKKSRSLIFNKMVKK